jgi:hypothetical protein
VADVVETTQLYFRDYFIGSFSTPGMKKKRRNADDDPGPHLLRHVIGSSFL